MPESVIRLIYDKVNLAAHPLRIYGSQYSFLQDFWAVVHSFSEPNTVMRHPVVDLHMPSVETSRICPLYQQQCGLFSFFSTQVHRGLQGPDE